MAGCLFVERTIPSVSDSNRIFAVLSEKNRMDGEKLTSTSSSLFAGNSARWFTSSRARPRCWSRSIVWGDPN